MKNNRLWLVRGGCALAPPVEALLHAAGEPTRVVPRAEKSIRIPDGTVVYLVGFGSDPPQILDWQHDDEYSGTVLVRESREVAEELDYLQRKDQVVRAHDEIIRWKLQSFMIGWITQTIMADGALTAADLIQGVEVGVREAKEKST